MSDRRNATSPSCPEEFKRRAIAPIREEGCTPGVQGASAPYPEEGGASCSIRGLLRLENVPPRQWPLRVHRALNADFAIRSPARC